MSSQPIAVPEGARATHLRAAAVPWEHVALGAILVLAAILNFFELSRVGLGNTYYAAAVKSMMQSWHNFFFVSFDPGGFVTIDKPPLAFWLQTASAKLFGFNGISLMLPEALAGVASVWLMYLLVARIFGRPAGLLSALALALSPVIVLVARSNLVESVLVCTLLLAAWAASKAVEKSSLRWMLLAATFMGLAFNVKSLEAYLAAPAIFLFYFVGARIRWYDRIWQSVLAAIVMLVVSLSWTTAVDLTPAGQRPYVASSGNNTELNLELGYNGLGRLTGNTFSFLNGGATVSGTLSHLSATNLGFTQGETGSPGIQRLVNAELGSQTGWLVVLAIIGFIAVIWQRRPRWPLDLEQSSAVLWGAWLATAGIFFSIAGTIHAYYVATLAPPVAALSGIAVVMLWRQYRAGGWRGWALPLALAATALTQAHILSFFPDWSRWMTPVVVGITVVLALVLAAARFRPVARRLAPLSVRRTALGAAILSVAALLLSPFVWSEYTVANASGAMVPSAGPSGIGRFGGFGGYRGRFTGRGFGGEFGGFGSGSGRAFGGFGGSGSGGQPGNGRLVPLGGSGEAGWRGFAGPDDGTAANPALIRYLESHQGNARFLVATLNAMTAEPFILTTGKPVMDLGGFMGGDKILTAQQLASDVAKGEVRYFLISGRGGRRFTPQFNTENLPPRIRKLLAQREREFGGRFGGGFGGAAGANNDLVQWVTKNCRVVPSSAYGMTALSPNSGGGFGATQPLYDCSAYSSARAGA